jgi:hypothetical protein
MYRVGRFAAGFRNAYHHRDVFVIDALLRAHWRREAARFVPRRPRAFLVARYVPA